MTDYVSLRNSAVSAGVEGSVTVNQRLLIDKMLARYSSNFAVCRELIQNSDDAQAKVFTMDLTVEDKDMIKEIRCSNNGRMFISTDWDRLTAIAEGNPDESTVGMFGVGFYSVFSWTEEPIVISGDSYMAFVWKGNSLQTFRAKLEEEPNKQMTTVVMKMRDAYTLKLTSNEAKTDKSQNNSKLVEATAAPCLDLPVLTSFFAKVLSFTKYLNELSININGKMVFRVTKRRTNPIVHDLLDPFTSVKGMFTVHQLVETIQTFDLEKRTGLNINNKAIETDSLVLKHIEAEANVRLEPSFHQQTQRIMKKTLPKKSIVQVLYPFNSQMDNMNNMDKLHDELKALLPLRRKPISKSVTFSIEPVGQCFIGLATSQTTGNGVSIHAQLIPTIERELIDLQDPYLRQWNSELLVTIGQIMSMVYSNAMTKCQQRIKYKQAKLTDEEIAILLASAFTVSTPSAEVGELLVQGFFQKSSDIFLVPAIEAGQHVLIDSRHAYLPLGDLHMILSGLAVIDPALLLHASSLFEALFQRGILNRISTQQIESSLKQTILSSDQLSCLFQWICSNAEGAGMQLYAKQMDLKRLLASVRYHAKEDATISLSEVKYYQADDGDISGVLPVPDTVLLASIARGLSSEQLTQRLKFKTFTFDVWLQFIVDNPQKSLLEDVNTAPSILSYLSRHSGELNVTQSRLVKKVLGGCRSIFTSQGMKFPHESYIASSTIHSDLPTVAMTVVKTHHHDSDESDESDLSDDDLSMDINEIGITSDTISIEFLKSIGVRTLPAVMTFINQEKAVNMKEFLKSLISQRKDLSETDWESLKSTKCLNGLPFSQWQESPSHNSILYAPNELHFPSVGKELQCPSLLILAWAGDLDKNSREYSFLCQLGVRSVPTLSLILNYCAESALNNTALNFFIKHFKQHYSDEYKSTANMIAFLPSSTNGNNESSLCTPDSVFLEENPFAPRILPSIASLMEEAGITELIGIKVRPTIIQAFEALKVNPPTVENAAELFAYMNSLEGLNFSVIQKIAKTRFIPVVGSEQLRLPSEVFIRPDRKEENKSEEINSAQDESDSQQDDSDHQQSNSLKRKVQEKRKVGKSRTGKKHKPESNRVESDNDNMSSTAFDETDSDLLDLPGILDYIDYGLQANSFLSSCQVLSYPTVSNLANLLILHHHRYFQQEGLSTHEKGKRYLAALRYLAFNMKLLDKSTQKQMRAKSWALGLQRFNNSSADRSSDMTSAVRPCTYKVVPLSQVFLIDDHSLERLLNPLCCPDELYVLYNHFGSQWISEAVSRSLAPIGTKQISDRANKLQSLIHHRLPLLLLTRRGERLKGIKQSGEGLVSNISVYEVPGIEFTVTFRGKTKVFKKSNEVSTCALIAHKKVGILYLHCKCEIDYFDIAAELARVLLPNADEGIVSHMSVLLSSPLNVLSRRGLPIERLLKQHEEEDIEMESGEDDCRETEVELGGTVTDFASNIHKRSSQITSLLKKGKSYTKNKMVESAHVREELNHSCDNIQASNLTRVMKNFHSIPLFIENGLQLDTSMTAAAYQFASMLQGFALKVFNIKLNCLHMYHDVKSARVGYNAEGALFFNLRYFMQVHLPHLSKVDGLSNTLNYWFMTICHELAHNGVNAHNAEHEEYIESLAVHSMNDFVRFTQSFQFIEN